MALMRRLDEIHTQHPFFGSRKMVAILQREGYKINRKRIQGLMQQMGLRGEVPSPSTSKSHPQHLKYPYLLSGLSIVRPLQVWSTDITYIRLKDGFLYLTAVIDWFSRLVLSWNLSNSLESAFCLEALEGALLWGKPEIFNTDQGIQYTSQIFVDAIISRGMRLSMDGKGRALDNIFVERLWRSLKYEEVYLKEYENVREARRGIGNYFAFYNHKRPHQALSYKTPFEIHHAFGHVPAIADACS